MTTSREFDGTGLEILTAEESRKLLASVPVGRLVFTLGGLPAVRLVNFLVDRDTIVIATGPGDKYRAAERGDVVAFEADDIDPDRHLGWTVTVIGHLSVVSPEDTARLQRALPLHPWAPDRDQHYVRLGIETSSGRRLLPWGLRPQTA
ncbi:pyridoxamine 5'-phosphate oxidase family protein [Kribbella lupini]|uniref:Pyridoxamine 5'-phosphate oxidase family protein n=1 Tax=Kribbella lupini TaxID=291602 RepID=A0ABP4LDF0_9ACTN